MTPEQIERRSGVFSRRKTTHSTEPTANKLGLPPNSSKQRCYSNRADVAKTKRKGPSLTTRVFFRPRPVDSAHGRSSDIGQQRLRRALVVDLGYDEHRHAQHKKSCREEVQNNELNRFSRHFSHLPKVVPAKTMP